MRAFLITLCLTLTAVAHAREDVGYFEKRYQTKIEGVNPIESYSDPDEYYSEIAGRLGIPQAAFDAVAKAYGWTPSPTQQFQAIVRRNQQKWTVLVIHVSLDEKTGNPLKGKPATRFVQMNDDRTILYCGEKQPR